MSLQQCGLDEAALKKAMEAFIGSDKQELSSFAKFTGDVQCRFVEQEARQGWETGPEGLVVSLLPSTARRILGAAWAFRWSNGVVITPTLVGLIRTGVIAHIAAGEGPTLSRIGERLIGVDAARNLGNLWGGLHLLELQGWARHHGRDARSRFYLTELGKAVTETVAAHRETFEMVVNDLGALKHYHGLCHNRRRDPAAVERFTRYVAVSNRSWDLPVGKGSRMQRLATRQLVNALDGLVMGTALVAMGMPVYEKRDNRLVAGSGSVFSRFCDSEAWLDSATLAEGVNNEFVKAVMEWLALRGLAQAEAGRVRLTAQGVVQIRITPPLAALGVSYLPSYQSIDDLLIGNPDPCGIDADTHVDRVMNVYGSSGAGSGPASEVINQHIIRRLFDELPLDRQPAGIADMGCGDGTALKRLADYVIHHTRRGRHLNDYPLVVVGADYNDAPLERTRETLSAYAAIDGVRVRVVKADIARPDAYNESVMAAGITITDAASGRSRPLRLSDLLHTFMFLVHNRRLSIRDPAEAREIIAAAMAEMDPQRLDALLQTYFEKPLPQGSDERIDAVLECFAVSFSDAHGLVEGAVAAADLVDFLWRWRPYATHGLVSLEGHSPAAYVADEEPPEDDQAWMRCDKLPHPLNWGMHFQSRQFMMPFNEYRLVLALAGYEPFDGRIHGGIYPPVVPSIDQLAQHRFFSIGCYVACAQSPELPE